MDGRQPIDGGQAAAPPGTSMEHPFLVLVEGSQMGVVSWCLQLVSANRHMQGEIETWWLPQFCPSPPASTPPSQGLQHLGKGPDKLKDPLSEVAQDAPLGITGDP